MSSATMNPASELSITFEGPGEFAELVGGDQGNFLVRRAGSPAREVAVVLNHQASEVLAKDLGMENTEEFRLGLVRIVGRRAIERLFEESHRIDGLMTVSAASLREDPQLLAAARHALDSMPNVPDEAETSSNELHQVAQH